MFFTVGFLGRGCRGERQPEEIEMVFGSLDLRLGMGDGCGRPLKLRCGVLQTLEGSGLEFM